MTELANITGLDETIKALRNLPKAISGKGGGPLRKALFAAAKMLKAEVKQAAPVYKGHDPDVIPGVLRDNIAIFRDRHPEKVGAAERYTIGVRKQRIKYAHSAKNARLGRIGKSFKTSRASRLAAWIEFGHNIVRNGQVIGKVPPDPFFRRSFEGKKAQVLPIFSDALRKEVGKAVEAAKLGNV